MFGFIVLLSVHIGPPRMTTQVPPPPFHWTAIPLQFEILVKMTRIVAEMARTQ